MPIAKLTHAFIHYRLEGPEGAPVVVLSNSLGTDMNMWDVQASKLQSSFRVLRYDTRGHGGSSGCAGPYTLDALGSDVVELLDELQIDRVHLCGISLGGLTVLWLALHHPDRVRSVMPCNTAARIGTAAGWDHRIWQVTTHGLYAIADLTMERWFTGSFRESHRELVTQTRRMFCSTDAAGYVACCEALRNADLRADLRRIQVPALIISSTNDTVTPSSDGHYLQRNIPGAQFEELAGAHLSNIEEATAFTVAMERFFSRRS
jgi:3-oxoadipate enol-lactonase